MTGVINKEAFFIGSFPVYWYGIIVTIAFVVAIFLFLKAVRQAGLNEESCIDLLFWSLVFAMLGARLYHVIFNWNDYKSDMASILDFRAGGLAIHGGIFIGCLVGYFIARRKGLPYFQILDIAAPSIILGQAIGRWGNFFNQEGYGFPVGRNVLQDMNLPGWLIEQMSKGGVYYHPNFLYESLWAFIGFLILISLRRGVKLFPGELFAIYVIWYSFGRFYIEGLRENDVLSINAPIWLAKFLNFLWYPIHILINVPASSIGGEVRIGQLVSLLLIVCAVWFIYKQRRSKTNRQ